jgi:hypothetical protein
MKAFTIEELGGQHVVKEPTGTVGTRRYSCDTP